jgi:apolipoprotein D and lipocalin family protein
MSGRRRIRLAACAGFLLAATGCANHRPVIRPVDQVDLARFMGDWYVIAHIPSRPERDAFNAVESYSLQADGTIRTTFRYRNGSFDAPLKTMRPRGFVQPGTGNAVWGMQFIWPIRAEYIIAGLDAGYSQTIIARNARDYAWIMARTPTIAEADYDVAVARLRAFGYDVGTLRRVPQRWPEVSGPRAAID